MKFESYYDEYMNQWTIRDTETLVMYPVTSENMANEFANLLNKYDEKYIDEYSLRETLQIDLQRVEEENEQLKIDLGIAEDNRKLDKEIIDDIHNEFQKVKEENEQLKSKYYWYKQYKELLNENEQLKQFIQELTTKGTAKIHLANGGIYKVDAILSDFKGDVK